MADVSATVLEVKQNPKKPENAFVKLDDGQDCWCPSYEAAAKLEIGKPLPQGWDVSQGEYGPRLFPPKEKKGFGGGAAAFRNTKEGQAVEQERMDRRTALMQAVSCYGSETRTQITAAADDFYEWLRRTAGIDRPSTPAGTSIGKDEGATGSGVDRVQSPVLSTEAVAAGDCAHLNTTGFKPDDTAYPRGYVRCTDCQTVFKQ